MRFFQGRSGKTAIRNSQIRLAELREGKIRRSNPGPSHLAGFEVTPVGRFSTDPRGQEIRTANDLFGRMTELRNGITHFLIEGDDGESQVYLADGNQLRIYSIAGSALLLYAHRMLEALQRYYARNLEGRLMRGMVLPMPANRDAFVVRARDYDME